MPDLESLDQFKNVVNSLGNEPQILEERGENFEDVPRPEQGLPEDLTDLLGDTEGLEEEETPDTGEDLNELLEGFAGEEEESGEPAEGEGPFDEFDFNEDLDALGDLEADSEEDEAAGGEEPEALEGFEEPETEEEPEEPETEEEPEAPEAPEEEDFDLDALIEETSSERRGEETPPEAAEGAGEDSFGEGELEIGDVDEDFDLDIDADLGDLEAEESEEPEEPEEPEGLGDSFDLDIDSDLGDLGGPEDLETEEPGAEAEEGAETEGAVEEPEFDIDADLGELGEPGGEEEPEPSEAEDGEEEEAPAEAEAVGTGGEELEFEDEFDLGEDMEFPFDDTAVEEGEAEEEIEEPGIDFEDVPSAEEFELPGEEGIEDIEEDFEVDQFDLGDLSEEFDLGEEGAEEAGFGELPEAEAEVPEEGEVEISDDEFLDIRRTLGTLPLNLKMAIEELIGEKGLAGEDLKKLLDMLSSGESPKAIASVTGKITGKKIEIPESYTKKSGAEFEAEQESFAYIFKHKIFPYVKIGLAVLIVLGFLGFIGYRFVYTPLYANSLYKEGYEALQEEEYVPAEEKFARAYEVRPKKDWFYTYAEGFIEKKQYGRAEKMYDWLISEYPDDKKGLMDYAHLESNILSNYRKAESLLNEVLDEEMYDFDALLASGDNYLAWAKDNPSKFENARVAYATLLQEYGGRPEILFRMLHYFIRTDNYDEVMRLKNQFQADPALKINPDIYAELGGYLIDKNRLNDVKDVLFRAMDVDRTIPEIHYHLARYYRDLQDYGEEEKALRNALRLLREVSPLTTERLAMLIDTYNRVGETHYRKEEFLQAEESYQNGIQLYEDARERKLLGPSPKFGKLYANLGDVYYYASGNLNTAYSLFEEAEDNMYSPPSADYKKGFILYGREDFRGSLMEFYEAAGAFSDNKNLMYSTANSLYQRGEYFAAQGYYNHLLDILEQEEDTIPYLMINEREDHRSIVESLMKVYNNLGVTLNRLSDKSQDTSKYSRSLAYLTRSTEYADILSRDFETMERSNTTDLAYLNMRSILYPDAVNELQIYTNLPKDMQDLLF